MPRNRAVLILVTVAVLLIGACTGGDEPTLVSTTTTAPNPFCDRATAFITDDSVTAVESFSAAFFADVDRRLGELVDVAPAEIRQDFVALRTAFSDSDAIFAEFDYDITDPRLGPALRDVDNDTMLDATDRIQAYLERECGLDPPGTVDPGEVLDIMDAFGVDREMAECLNAELGDVANIDSEELTTELLTQPVCGTSLLALLSGAGPGG